MSNDITLPGISTNAPRELIVPGIQLGETISFYQRSGWTVQTLSMVPGSLSQWRLLISKNE